MSGKNITPESVSAQPMRLHEFYASTGYCLDDRPDVDGYVVCNGNNETWYEKELFEEKYMTNGMLFGMAIEALKKGKRVARAGWNGKGMWLYLVTGSSLASALGYGFGEYIGELTIVNSIAMKTADNKVVIGWLASQTDMFADDWTIVE